MSVRKAPNDPKDPKSIISRGGEVRSDRNENAEEEATSVQINLRTPPILVDRIEKALKKRIGLSRNAWILEAIQEKIKRDEDI